MRRVWCAVCDGRCFTHYILRIDRDCTFLSTVKSVICIDTFRRQVRSFALTTPNRNYELLKKSQSFTAFPLFYWYFRARNEFFFFILYSTSAANFAFPWASALHNSHSTCVLATSLVTINTLHTCYNILQFTTYT
jgi:hypothetical protein